MWPGSSVLIVINALVLLVYSLPSNIDWNTLRNDPDSITLNEKILKLFLHLAVRTADRLTHLRKEIDKEDECNRGNDNLLLSKTEVLVTQSPLQANLEENQEIHNHLSSGDSKINNDFSQFDKNSDTILSISSIKIKDQDQTVSYPDPNNFLSITDVRNLNLKTSNLIPKSVQNVQDASSDVIGYNHEALNYGTSQTSILDSNTTSNLLNANESRLDVRDSLELTRDGVSQRLLNSVDLEKDIANTAVINDLTETVDKFLPESQNLQSTLGVSQQLLGTDLPQIVPKIISNVHENVNQHISRVQNIREPSNKINGVSQRFLDPIIIKDSGNIVNPEPVNNLSTVNQILSSTKNVVESLIKVLPENTKSALNKIIPQSQDTINKPEVAEEGRKYLAHSGNTQQKRNKNAEQVEEPSDRINGVSQRFLDPIIIKDSGNIVNPEPINNLSTVNQILSSTKNVVESLIKVLPENAKSVLNKIIPQSQDIINTPSKVPEEGRKYLAYSDNTQQERNKNAEQAEEPSDKINRVTQRFLDPFIIKDSGNIINQPVDNLTAMNQILSSTKNVMEWLIKVLPENTKSMLNKIIPQSQDIINTPSKVTEEGRKNLAYSGNTRQERNENAKQAEDEFDNLLHNHEDLISNSGSNIREAPNASERNNQETSVNDLLINKDNSTAEGSNNQYVPALLNDQKDPSIPLLRSLPDFNEHENDNKKTETDLSSIQSNENANSFTDEKLSKRNHGETDQRVDQINEELKVEGFKKMDKTRTDYSDEQLNPVSKDLSQKSEESGLEDSAVATSILPNQLESHVSTLVPITEHQAESSSDVQDLQGSENVNNIIKSDLEETKKLQDNPSANNGIIQSNENLVTHVDDNLKNENLHVRMSEAKLQEIGDRLINALWPIIEKRMSSNQSYVTDYYSEQRNKRLPSNISDSRQAIYEHDSNYERNHDQVANSTSRSPEDQDYSRRKEDVGIRR